MRVGSPPLKCLIIGTPGDVRVEGFQSALEKFDHPPAEVIGYPAWVSLSDWDRRDQIKAADRVRIESPGRDPKALHAIRWRWQHPDQPMDTQPNDAIGDPTSFATSLTTVMEHIERASTNSESVFLNHPLQTLSACDKVKTIELLEETGIPVPRTLAMLEGQEIGYDIVRDAMRSTGINRVFIKLRHGYSGSGVIAYQLGKGRELAITTVAMKQTDNGIQLFNTRKVQRYDSHQDCRKLFDALCPLGVYVERWVPKAGVNNRTTDLRVVTIAGKARHIVMRMSKGPITNLHLLNERSSPEPLRAQMRPSDWDAMIQTCKRVARCFPNMLYLGIDVAVHPDLRGHTVFEVNAWGDLLKGVLDRGQTTYEAEVEAMGDWRGSLD
jgi:hypothetical protein